MDVGRLGRAATVALVDLACVLLFVGVGRVSHGEDLGIAGLTRTVGPFLVGWLVGLVLVMIVPATRADPRRLLGGALVWVATVVVGLVVRHATGGGIETSFVVVTAVVLGVFLLGWRAVAGAVGRRSTDVVADPQV